MTAYLINGSTGKTMTPKQAYQGAAAWCDTALAGPIKTNVMTDELRQITPPVMVGFLWPSADPFQNGLAR